MSTIAYKDKNKTETITISEAVLLNNDRKYYCKNKKCAAELVVVARNGVKTPYFRALKSKPHMRACLYGSEDFKNYTINDFDEKEFDLDDKIQSLSTVSDSKSDREVDKGSKIKLCNNGKQHIRTIKQIYFICKTQLENKEFNGVSIEKYYIDSEIYTIAYQQSGNKLIECKTNKYLYNEEKSEIYLNTKQIGILILKFIDKKLYKVARKYFYNNKDRLFIIAGYLQIDMVNSINVYLINIFSKKQFCYVK